MTRLVDAVFGSAAGGRKGIDPWGSYAATRVQTRALKRFLGCLSSRDAPVLLDLGPVVGPNVAFFGELLGCKIFVEDIHEDIERFTRNRTWDQLPDFLSTRFDRPDGSIDGILCWDLFDHLDKRAAGVLARELSRLLKPGGALLAFFATTPETTFRYSKFVVVDDNTLQHKSATSTGSRARQASEPGADAAGRHVLPSRETDRLFDGLHVSQSFLLRARMRETLFRKPSPEEKVAPAPAPAPVRRKRPTSARPKPAVASLKLAVGRASAGVRRTSASRDLGVNGVSRQAHPEKLPLTPKSKQARVRRSDVEGQVRAARFKVGGGQ